MSTGHVAPVSAANKQALEAQLDRALEEYDESQIGALDDDSEDEDMQGDLLIDEDDVMDPELEAALDEYLQAQKARVYAEGTIEKGARRLIEVEEVTEGVKEVDIAKEAATQRAQQQIWQEELQELQASKSSMEEEWKQIVDSQAYLREEKIEEQWDCETVLSTYSTRDNLPSVLRRPKKKSNSTAGGSSVRDDVSVSGSIASSNVNKPTRHMSKPQYEEYLSYLSENSSASTSAAPALVPGSARGPIRLTGKLGLPEGYGPYSGKTSKKSKQRNKDREVARNIPEVVEEGDEEEEDEEESEEEDEDEEHEGEEVEEEKGEEDEKDPRPPKGRKKESTEEKKLRKAQVKQQQRERRMQKKELKNAFREETGKVVKRLGIEPATERHTVYTYS
jgi:hypothetical protein